MGKIEDLEKLQELKEAGTLSEEEFETEKYKVLNSDNDKLNNDEKSSKRALVGFILGLCSIVAWFIPLIGFPVTVLGIIFSTLGLNSNRKSLSITGIVLSVIFFVITLINSITGAIMMSNYYSNYYF